ncbi:dsDNA nuclease domain-containing protein [Flavivirga spongiicola]|uniref:DUF4297 domain-containing protein n=1 Tax=Flavivirga spongiicola TaxID=421621 RepID=A0ABU7XTV4_9FLAO|nr:dsDNA nuclease domain-containing protein [Flavivirga sp. MEBiC05379]MDO5979205.1 dsDNA nuclease domain-containing protein [Flavivirga sp. MEBiC05379]
MNKSPDKEIDFNDPGDETLKRYAYQVYYSILIALSILDSENDIEEVFCEQFEDVLAKESSGKFIGIQVKTRDLNLGPFKSIDNPVIKSLKRFVDLDKKFPNQFRKFVFATNTGMDSSTSHYNLKHLILLAELDSVDELTKARSKGKKIINQICKELSCDIEDVLNTLKKVEVHSKYANLENINLHIVDKLTKMSLTKGQNLGVLNSIANKLFGYHFKAAALQKDENLVENYLQQKPEIEIQTQQRIEGKRITKEKLNELISDELKNPVSLFLKDTTNLAQIPKTDSKVELKMDAGGISSENIGLMKDLKYSLETYLMELMYKEGTFDASKKYNQIRLLVNAESQEAFDDEYSDENNFGTSMLVNLRKRLKTSTKEDADGVLNFRYEHLMGMSSILTEDCKVWWSKKFDIE